VREDTRSVLIVVEAVHATASADVARLIATLAGELESVFSIIPRRALLGSSAPHFEFWPTGRPAPSP